MLCRRRKDIKKSTGGEFVGELRTTRWVVAAKADRRNLNRTGFSLLIVSALLTASMVVCLALDVGQGSEGRKESPSEFDWAAVFALGSVALAGLSLFVPRAQPKASEAVAAGRITDPPSNKFAWILAALSFVLLMVALGLALFAVIHSV